MGQSPDERTDEELASLVASQDAGAFAVLYDRYAARLYAWAAHLLGPVAAEDAVQEVYVRLWDRASQFDPGRGRFRPWFWAIARHHFLHELVRDRRQRLRAAEMIDALLAEPAVDVAELSLRRQNASAALHSLAQIPADQRRALIMAYFGGLTQAEIATATGWPLGTVKKRIRLGLQKLRASLRPRDPTAVLGGTDR